MKNGSPYTILAIGPFSFSNPGQQGIILDFPGQIEKNMSGMEASISIPMEKRLYREGSLDLCFHGPDDFYLDNIIGNTPWLDNLKAAADYIAGAVAEGRSAPEIHRRLTAWENLPIHFDAPAAAAGFDVPADVSSPLDDLLSMVDIPGENADSTTAGPEAWQAAVKDLLERNLAALFSHSGFMRLKSAWSGLSLLAERCAGLDALFLQTLSLPVEDIGALAETLSRDLPRATPDLVLVDFEFDNSPRSLGIVKALASVCEDFLVPAVIAVNEQFFYLDTWDDISRLPYLPNYLEELRFAGWKKLVASPQASWLSATCNPFEYDSSQTVGGPEPDSPFAGETTSRLNPVWALGALCARSIEACGWPTRFTDHSRFRMENKKVVLDVSEERAAGFIRAGFMPLSGDKAGRTVFFLDETAISGASFCRQLLISRSVAFFIRLDRAGYENLSPETVRDHIQAAWIYFWDSTGAGRPDKDLIKLAPDKTGRLVLEVSFIPPAAVVPGSGPVEFTLLW